VCIGLPRLIAWIVAGIQGSSPAKVLNYLLILGSWNVWGLNAGAKKWCIYLRCLWWRYIQSICTRKAVLEYWSPIYLGTEYYYRRTKYLDEQASIPVLLVGDITSKEVLPGFSNKGVSLPVGIRLSIYPSAPFVAFF
jgi:hypothetical protein